MTPDSLDEIKVGCTFTEGLEILMCSGSIRQVVEEGCNIFRLTVTNETAAKALFMRQLGIEPRLAVVDPEGWRAEVNVVNAETVDDSDCILYLKPASFPCPRCDENSEGCERCEGVGVLPPHVIKGEWFVPGRVVEGPGTYEVEDEAGHRRVEACWRPCDD